MKQTPILRLFFSPKRALIRTLVLTFGVILVLFSWWSELFEKSQPSTIFLIDNSLSSAVQDISTVSSTFETRLNAEKLFARTFSQNNTSPIAVATFSRNLTLEMPFTDDKTLTDNVISGINIQTYGGGSDILSALASIFAIYKNHHNVILFVLSDMENFENFAQKVEKPSDFDVHFIGFWTQNGGVMLEGYGTDGKPLYRQFEGKNAISSLDEKSGEILAKMFDGDFSVIDHTDQIPALVWAFQTEKFSKNSSKISLTLLLWCFLLAFGAIFPIYKPK